MEGDAKEISSGQLEKRVCGLKSLQKAVYDYLIVEDGGLRSKLEGLKECLKYCENRPEKEGEKIVLKDRYRWWKMEIVRKVLWDVTVKDNVVKGLHECWRVGN